jgi:excinuclease ABC subunit A
VEVVRQRAGAAAEVTVFSERYACPKCGLSLPELEPRQFSFNSPYGACPTCSGLGTRREVAADLVLGDARLSILEGVILPWGEPSGYLRKVILPTLARTFKFDLATAWEALPAAVRKVVLHGVPGRTLTYQYDSGRAHGEYESSWEGVLRHVERRYRETASESVRAQLEEYMLEQPCPDCGGKRLRPESLAVLVGGKSLGDVVELSVGDALQFFEGLPLRSDRRPGLDRDIAGPILKEVNDRLRFLKNVGLAYLTLGRSAA